MTKHAIIDPPVGPYSSAKDVAAWIEELERLEESDEKAYALEEAREWLEHAREREGN